MTAFEVFILTVISLTSARPDPGTLAAGRVFVGAQQLVVEGVDLDGYAYTMCIPEAKGLFIQATPKLLTKDAESARFAAAHEVAHTLLHRELLCDHERLAGLPLVRRREMEVEADRCATLLLAGAACR